MKNEVWVRVVLGMFVVAFGANLFAPMVLTYRQHTALTETHTTFLYGVYAVGLIGALFIGGPVSDVRGRRAVLRPALLATALGSLILLVGLHGSFLALLAGRLIIGVAVGLVMSAGASWVKELSATVAIGAKRSSLALTLGFALAPALAGLLAQFTPWPTLAPYVPHLVLALLIVPLAWTAPEGPRPQAGKAHPPLSLLTREFVPVAVFAPWVFGVVTTSFAYLPGLVMGHLAHPIAAAGLLAMLTMGTGAVVQRWALGLGASAGLGLAAVGMVVGAVIAANRDHAWVVWLLPVASVVLGAAYGILMVVGLAKTQEVAPAAELGAATGVYYALTYLGFFAPFLLSLLAPRVGHATSFAVGTAVALATLALVWVSSRGKAAK